MNTKVWQSIENYLKQRQIEYVPHVADGMQSICMGFLGYENTPDGIVEGCAFFHPSSLEWRTYYSEYAAGICAHSQHRGRLYELLNYINASVWIRGEGGIPYPYAPRIYMTQDGAYDITMTALVPYVFYNVAPDETCAFFIQTAPEILNGLATPIFSLLRGEITVGEACDKIASMK